MYRWNAGFLAVLFCLLLAEGKANADEVGQWEIVQSHEGIEISIKEIEGRDLPIFRGVGIVNADLWDVAAVLVDVEERVNWAHKCVGTRVVRDEGPRGRIIYDRVDAPWPVSDRDVVVRSKMEFDPEKNSIFIDFKNVWDCDAPELEGVVRMPRMRGHYVLKSMPSGATEVEYQIDADPGGMLPNWLIDLASREIPLETLKARLQNLLSTGSTRH